MTLNVSEFEAKYSRTRKPYSEASPTLPDFTPSEIRAFFKKYGLCSFEDGFLWTVDPSEYKEHYQPWFDYLALQELVDAETAQPFVKTAFGTILYYDAKGEVGSISVTTNSNTNISLNFYLNDIFTNEGSLIDSYYYDIFTEALQAHGPLLEDECFGFLPPLALGGELDPQYVHKVKLKEHLALLSEFVDRG